MCLLSPLQARVALLKMLDIVFSYYNPDVRNDDLVLDTRTRELSTHRIHLSACVGYRGKKYCLLNISYDQSEHL